MRPARRAREEQLQKNSGEFPRSERSDKFLRGKTSFLPDWAFSLLRLTDSHRPASILS